MKIAFVTNFINHHQVYLADELYGILGGDYCFIETQKMPTTFIKSGYPDFSLRPYIIKAWVDNDSWKSAISIAESVDILIVGNAPQIFRTQRLRNNSITIEYEERSLKKGWINVFSPRFIRKIVSYLIYDTHNTYKLCAGAYVANDMYKFGLFKNRCFKFGYFPQTPNKNNNKNNYALGKNDSIKILWCGRFISWKHPELPVYLAEKLKLSQHKFEINMIGSGELYNDIKSLIEKKNLSNEITLLGNLPNKNVLDTMAEHDIFIFTSDRNEGWGAVLNEAMGCGCCPVVSNEIGAVPYLINDKENGLVFKSKDVDSLYQCISFLIHHPQKIKEFADNSYQTISNIWCPKIAANNLLTLCNSLYKGNKNTILEGPCSNAFPYYI